MGVTMHDIGRKVGVSTVTVSNALNGRSGVSEKLRAKIKQTAADMGYIIQPSEKRMLDVGILIPSHFFGPESFYQMLYKLVVEALSQKGHFVLFELMSQQMDKKLIMPNFLRTRHVDAVVLLGQPSKEYVRTIAAQEIPVIFLDFYDEFASADAITGDSLYGSYRLTSHLIREGHKQIAFLGDRMSTSSNMERYLGYYRAMITNNLPIKEEWIIPDRDENGWKIEYKLPSKLPTAFVCCCDITAFQLMKILQAKGIRIPEDVSVVGFDDFLGGMKADPALSTFRMDYTGMAQMTVNLVEERCSGSTRSFGRVVIGGNPVYRASDAPLTQE